MTRVGTHSDDTNREPILTMPTGTRNYPRRRDPRYKNFNHPETNPPPPPRSHTPHTTEQENPKPRSTPNSSPQLYSLLRKSCSALFREDSARTPSDTQLFRVVRDTRCTSHRKGFLHPPRGLLHSDTPKRSACSWSTGWRSWGGLFSVAADRPWVWD